MKIKQRKLFVFLLLDIQFLLLLIGMLLFYPEGLSSFGPLLVNSIVMTGLVYVGGNVAHAWQKSMNYNKELDDEKVLNG